MRATTSVFSQRNIAHGAVTVKTVTLRTVTLKIVTLKALLRMVVLAVTACWMLTPACQAQKRGGASETASLRGTVRDVHSGEPIPGVIVHVNTTAMTFQGGGFVVAPGADERGMATTDEHGRYALSGIPAGSRSVRAFNPKGVFTTSGRFLDLRAGETREDFDIRIENPATIVGRVLDENGEPLAGASVSVVAQEYYLGAARYYLRFMGFADDTGAYEIEKVPVGRKVRLMAEMPPTNFDALAASKAPADPKQRRPAYARVFYPDLPHAEAGTLLTLRSGERREGMDFVIRRERSLCVEGSFLLSPDVGRLRITVEPATPSYGSSGREGHYGRTVSALVDVAKPFRICGLAAGEFRLSAATDVASGHPLQHYAVTSFVLMDEDLKDLQIAPTAPLKIPFRVDWEGTPPEGVSLDTVSVGLDALYRAYYPGEQRDGRSEVPGTGEFGAVLAGVYGVRVQLPTRRADRIDYALPASTVANGVYVKDIRYGNESVLHKAVDVGSEAEDGGIQVILGYDAGDVTARVVDKNGKSVSDCYVHLLPVNAGDETALAERLFTGQTDQNGVQRWQRNIPPGSYRAVATWAPVDYSPEGIHVLWLARSQAPEITLAPNGTAEVKVVIPEEK